MAMGDVIARLSVSLGLQTAAFEKGATLAEKRANKMKRNFAGLGKSIQMGALAIGGVVVGLNKVFGDLAQKSKEIRNSAQVAGEGFEEFQRQAYAAKSVGVEFDKLGDIFKDVRDRIGDFEQTGGGPMADFFENIAPKVGVTAEQFRGLGGKDALQLYYDSLKKANVSQEDMVFYLEAMASDTTNLIPLLDKGGAAWERYGDKASVITEEQAAQLQKYEDATLQIENAFQRIVLALVDSGLIDSMASFAENLGAVAEGFAGVEASAGASEEQLRKTEGWREFGSNVRSANDTIQQFVDDFDAMNARNAERTRAFWRGVSDGIGRTITFIESLPARVSAAMQRMYVGVKTWLQDKIGGVFDWVNKKVQTVEQGFAWLYDRVVGNSWVPDMVAEVGQHMAKLDALMVAPAKKATSKTEEAFRELASNVASIMERLFPAEARLKALRDDIAAIDAAEKAGLLSGDVANEARFRANREYRDDGEYQLPENFASPLATSEEVEKSIDNIGKKLGLVADKTKEQTVRIAKSFKDMAEETLGSLKRMTDAIKGGGFLDILEAAVGMFLQLGSTGLFGKGLAANINKTRGYATGTNSAARGWAWVGERGPELVKFRGGERVLNNRDSMNAGRGGGGIAQIVPSPYFDVVVDGRVMRAAPGIAGAGAQIAGQQAQFQRTRRLA